MFKLVVCVSILVTAVCADYDFKDSDFNEMLFDDLRLDFDDGFEESLRFRRDTEETASAQKECHHKKDRDFHCCTGEKADPKQFEALKEVKRKCIAEVRGENADETSFDPFDCERMQAMKEQMVCTAECMAKKFNLLEENGRLKREALLTHLRAKMGDNKWKADALEGFVDKCLAEVKASRQKEKKEQTDDAKKGCNPCPLQFTHCIWREFVQGCPAESQVDSGKCKKIRERLAKGDTSFLHKSFLHHLHHSHQEDKKDEEKAQ